MEIVLKLQGGGQKGLIRDDKEMLAKLPAGFSKISVMINVDLLRFSRPLEDLESSGRPRGKIST